MAGPDRIHQERYRRNRESLTPEDQERLGRARVAILGLGGLGGGVCEMLARTGIGHLTLVDGDRFDASNLNRQILSREDNLDVPKAQVAAERVAAVNSRVEVRVHQAFARADTLETMIGDAHLVVDCLDTIGARFDVQETAARTGIPLVSGAIAGMTGQVTVIFPGDSGFEAIYGPRPGPEGDAPGRGVETITGNLACCAMFVAALQVAECLKVLLNRGRTLRHRLMIADLWQSTVDIVELGEGP